MSPHRIAARLRIAASLGLFVIALSVSGCGRTFDSSACRKRDFGRTARARPS